MAPQDFIEVRRDYLAAFGELILTWNQAENTLRNLLLAACGVSTATHILTAELGSRGLSDGLRSIAVTLNIELQDAVEAVTALYDRLLAYRNYYVHGISSIGIANGLGVGLANIASAKGKLGFSEDRVTYQQLVNARTYALQLRDEAGAILDTINPREGSRVDPPLPSRKTLLLPDTLKKTLRYPLNEPAPPQS